MKPLSLSLRCTSSISMLILALIVMETHAPTSVGSDDNNQCSRCIDSGGQCGNNNYSFVCLCTDRYHSSSCSGATVAGVGILAVFAVIICNRKRYFSLAQRRLIFKKAGESDDQNVEDFITTYGFLAPKRYNYSEVKKITSSFCDQLGKGGYGVVYKGKLSDGCLVAVKVINE